MIYALNLLHSLICDGFSYGEYFSGNVCLVGFGGFSLVFCCWVDHLSIEIGQPESWT